MANIDNNILPLNEITEWLQDKKLYVIAKQTGLSYPTIRKLYGGDDHNFTIDTLRIISMHIIESKSKL